MAGGPSRRALGLAAILLASLLPAAWFALQQRAEDAVVDGYLRERGLAGLPVVHETAVRVSQAVRADFETDETKWKALDYKHRPFLRRETAWLLTAREGYCGEGTRVIVSLLQRLGFDATRLTLYDRHLQAVHTLVSVQLGDREVLVDSINSPDSTNMLLNRGELSTRDFRVVHYSDDILQRDAFARELAERDTLDADSLRTRFFRVYRVYSYEALPVSKLLTRAGVDWRVFNFARPARWVSYLAEKPRAIKAVAWLTLALVVDAALLLAMLSLARARRRAAARA